MTRCDMAYWWPILKETGVLVPRTMLVTTDTPLIELCDGTAPEGYEGFLWVLLGAADTIGYPCFLRTGETSNKHAWRRTCYLERPDDLAAHVYELVEFSAMADFFGLSTRTWAVREFLSLRHTFTAFEGMPVAREFRTFFAGGNPVPLCVHPYWPPGSIRNPSVPDWRERLEAMNEHNDMDDAAIRAIVAKVSSRFDGRWSLDLAQHADGRWFATDMAEMDRSFHWQGCPNDPHPEHHRPEPTDDERDALAASWLGIAQD